MLQVTDVRVTMQSGNVKTTTTPPLPVLGLYAAVKSDISDCKNLECLKVLKNDGKSILPAVVPMEETTEVAIIKMTLTVSAAGHFPGR